jgi:NADH dehydrogenase FAD-containing subunit
MGRHLALIGGGHAHLTTLLRLGELTGAGHQATLVSTDPYHYYSGMGPGMLSGIYRPEDVRFHVKRMAEDRGGEFIQDKVVSIEPAARTLRCQSGRVLRYDVASFNTGSDIPTGGIDLRGGSVYTVKPIVNLLEARKRIREFPDAVELRIVVAGGGPAGVELAGNVLRLLTEGGKAGVLTMVAGGEILRDYPEKIRTLARESLTARGARVLEGCHVRAVDEERITLDDGNTLPADIVFIASGVRPSGIFKASDIPVGPEGGLLVNRYLQSVARPELFGGGDCISLEGSPLDKVGVYAVRENPVLFHNLHASLEGRELMPFDPGGRDYLLIFNMGDGRGIFRKGRFIMDGAASFIIKDYIDRRFMRKFQVSGERDTN